MLMKRYKVALYIENFDLVGLNNDPSKIFHVICGGAVPFAKIYFILLL